MNHVSLAYGWAIIHSHLVSEGDRRMWVNAGIGEMPEEIRDWRTKAKATIPTID